MKPIIKAFLAANWKKFVMYIGAMAALFFVYSAFKTILAIWPEFSGLPYAITTALAGVITLKLVDELILYEIETMRILKRNAIAYAVYVLAYALVIAFAISGA